MDVRHRTLRTSGSEARLGGRKILADRGRQLVVRGHDVAVQRGQLAGRLGVELGSLARKAVDAVLPRIAAAQSISKLGEKAFVCYILFCLLQLSLKLLLLIVEILDLLLVLAENRRVLLQSRSDVLRGGGQICRRFSKSRDLTRLRSARPR